MNLAAWGERNGVARVSCADQKADLDRQVARVTAWATTQQIRVDRVVAEVAELLGVGRSTEYRALQHRLWRLS
jgi:predicted site-specific integrase-resolvase